MYLGLPFFVYLPCNQQIKVMQNQPKLGDVYKYVCEDKSLQREECDYFVLGLATGVRQNRVALFNINPQTMIDDRGWKFRHVWARAQKVQDPNNITPEEFTRICHDYNNEFVKLSSDEMAAVVEKFKGGRIVYDSKGFLHKFKFVPKK